MKRIDRIIIYSLFICPAAALLYYFVWAKTFDKTTEELIVSDDLKEDFSGRVQMLYFEKQNHNVKIAKLTNGYRYGIFRNWESYIEIGDSLHKSSGLLFLKVYKKDGKVIMLNYKDTYRR